MMFCLLCGSDMIQQNKPKSVLSSVQSYKFISPRSAPENRGKAATTTVENAHMSFRKPCKKSSLCYFEFSKLARITKLLALTSVCKP